MTATGQEKYGEMAQITAASRIPEFWTEKPRLWRGNSTSEAVGRSQIYFSYHVGVTNVVFFII